MNTDAASTKPTRAIWSRLGGQLGVGLCAIGFLLVFLGWNGAASVDRIPSQFPYLISGGVAGLCFVVLGVGMIVVQNQRADRAALQATLRELQESLERSGLAEGTAGRKPFAKPSPRPAPAPTDTSDDTAEGPVLVAPDGEVRTTPLVAPAPEPAPRKRPAKAAPKKASATGKAGAATSAGAKRPR